MERHLAAILAADVVGYSQLMGADEVGTLERLTRLRMERIEPLIASHRGRVFKLMGDGILVEFASVVDAVNCAVAWQRGMAAEDLRFRIGINLGDVIADDGDIYARAAAGPGSLSSSSMPRPAITSGQIATIAESMTNSRSRTRSPSGYPRF